MHRRVRQISPGMFGCQTAQEYHSKRSGRFIWFVGRSRKLLSNFFQRVQLIQVLFDHYECHVRPSNCGSPSRTIYKYSSLSFVRAEKKFWGLILRRYVISFYYQFDIQNSNKM